MEGVKKGRAGSSKEAVFGQGEVETFLPWPHPWGTFLEGARHHSYRQIEYDSFEVIQSRK